MSLEGEGRIDDIELAREMAEAEKPDMDESLKFEHPKDGKGHGIGLKAFHERQAREKSGEIQLEAEKPAREAAEANAIQKLKDERKNEFASRIEDDMQRVSARLKSGETASFSIDDFLRPEDHDLVGRAKMALESQLAISATEYTLNDEDRDSIATININDKKFELYPGEGAIKIVYSDGWEAYLGIAHPMYRNFIELSSSKTA